MFQLFTLLYADLINDHTVIAYACSLAYKKMFAILGTLYSWVLYVSLYSGRLGPGPYVLAYSPSLGTFYFPFHLDCVIVCL